MVRSAHCSRFTYDSITKVGQGAIARLIACSKQPTAPELYNPNTDEFLWRKEAPELSRQLGDFIDKLMARSARKRPANTGVILQELESLQRQLYPPKVRKLSQPSGKGPLPGSPRKTLRGFLKVTAGLAGGGLVTAVVGHQIWRNRLPSDIIKPDVPTPIVDPPSEPDVSTPIVDPPPEPDVSTPIVDPPPEPDVSTPIVDPPPEPKPSLLKFSFYVVTVNSRGREIDRQHLQAEYFQQSLGNGVTLDMVSIPGGTFMMGSP